MTRARVVSAISAITVGIVAGVMAAGLSSAVKIRCRNDR